MTIDQPQGGDATKKEDTNKSKIYFGVSLELAGKVISLEPKNAIDELVEKGIEVELPPGERVYLGTAGENVRKILDTFGVDDEGSETERYILPSGNLNPDKLPDVKALRDVANIVTNAQLYIDEFHIRIPGKGAKAEGNPPAGDSKKIQNNKESTAYTIALSAEWKSDEAGTGQELISGFNGLKLRGIYLKVTNEG